MTARPFAVGFAAGILLATAAALALDWWAASHRRMEGWK